MLSLEFYGQHFQQAITCSKLRTETLAQGVEYVQN